MPLARLSDLFIPVWDVMHRKKDQSLPMGCRQSTSITKIESVTVQGPGHRSAIPNQLHSNDLPGHSCVKRHPQHPVSGVSLILCNGILLHKQASARNERLSHPPVTDKRPAVSWKILNSWCVKELRRVERRAPESHRSSHIIIIRLRQTSVLVTSRTAPKSKSRLLYILRTYLLVAYRDIT